MFAIRAFFVASAVSANGVTCAVRHCAKEMGECLMDGKCRANLACNKECLDGGAEPGYCMSKCVFVDSPSEKATALSTCLNVNNCLTLPFPMNETCSPPKHSLKFNMSTLARGKPWWGIYGHSRTADCTPCQKRYIYPENDTAWWYNYTELMNAGHGNYANMTLHTPLTPTAEQKDSMTSWKWTWGGGGMNFVEEWWLLDDAQSYLQVYYCATLIGHGNPVMEGGLILAHTPHNFPAEALPKIRTKYTEMGVDFSKYCTVDNSCKAPAPPSTESAQQEIII